MYKASAVGRSHVVNLEYVPVTVTASPPVKATAFDSLAPCVPVANQSPLESQTMVLQYSPTTAPTLSTLEMLSFAVTLLSAESLGASTTQDCHIEYGFDGDVSNNNVRLYPFIFTSSSTFTFDANGFATAALTGNKYYLPAAYTDHHSGVVFSSPTAAIFSQSIYFGLEVRNLGASPATINDLYVSFFARYAVNNLRTFARDY